MSDWKYYLGASGNIYRDSGIHNSQLWCYYPEYGSWISIVDKVHLLAVTELSEEEAFLEML